MQGSKALCNLTDGTMTCEKCCDDKSCSCNSWLGQVDSWAPTHDGCDARGAGILMILACTLVTGAVLGVWS